MAKKAHFEIKKWSIDYEMNSITFHYECSINGLFKEKVIFPDFCKLTPSSELNALIDFAAYVIGISYYKCAASDSIVSKLPISSTELEAITSLYTEGLGEFYARNKLPYPPLIDFDIDLQEPKIPNSFDIDTLDENIPVVAFGGGKDSHVAVDILRKTGRNPILCSVILSENVGKKLSQMTPDKIHFIKRDIDPHLLVLNQDKRVFNGHIPITSINSILLAIFTTTIGKKWLVFSNERGASAATRTYMNKEVNHQYSKSLKYENLFRQVLSEIVPGQLNYFSILRPFSELWIAAVLGKEAQSIHKHVASCNKNFIFSNSKSLDLDSRWCGNCSKCVYTAIITAPHISKKQFMEIFEVDILNDPSNLQIAKDLCGLGNAKPWECVGEIEDTLTTMHFLSYAPEWKDSYLPKNMKNEIETLRDYKTSQDLFFSNLESRSTHFLPIALEDLTIKTK